MLMQDMDGSVCNLCTGSEPAADMLDGNMPCHAVLIAMINRNFEVPYVTVERV